MSSSQVVLPLAHVIEPDAALTRFGRASIPSSLLLDFILNLPSLLRGVSLVHQPHSLSLTYLVTVVNSFNSCPQLFTSYSLALRKAPRVSIRSVVREDLGQVGNSIALVFSAIRSNQFRARRHVWHSSARAWVSKGYDMLLKRCSLVGRRKQVGKDTADTMGLGTGEDMMVGEGGWSFLAPFCSSHSESASLGDAEGPFGTSI